MRDIVDEIDYPQREALSIVQSIIEEQEKSKEKSGTICGEVLATSNSKRAKNMEIAICSSKKGTGKTLRKSKRNGSR